MVMVIVAGATGGVGIYIVKKMLKLNYHVKALVRDTKRAQLLFQSELEEEDGGKLEFIEGDVTDLSKAKDKFAGASATICAIGSSGSMWFGHATPENIDYKGVSHLVDASKEAGIPKFVLAWELEV